MATTREEVLLRLGMDSKSLQAGMASMKTKMSAWAKSVGGQIMQGMAFAAILNQVKKTVDAVEQLTQRADALSISTSFLQDLENVGIAAGKSQQAMEKMVTVFAKGLAPGQDLETEFYKFLDAIKAIEDPVMRTKMAFDKFGKSGIILLDIAKDGSKAFKDAAAELDKFTQAEINTLLRLDKQLDQAKNSIATFTGWALGQWADFWAITGTISGGGAQNAGEAMGKILAARKLAEDAEFERRRKETWAAKDAAKQAAAGPMKSKPMGELVEQITPGAPNGPLSPADAKANWLGKINYEKSKRMQGISDALRRAGNRDAQADAFQKMADELTGMKEVMVEGEGIKVTIVGVKE